MKKSCIHFSCAKALFCLLLVAGIVFSLTACADAEDVVETPSSLLDAVQNVQSVEASISLEINGRFSGSGSSASSHTVSVRSDGTICSNFAALPNAYHAEYYSSILVDGVTTRESRDIYVVPDTDGYMTYEYEDVADEWHRSSVARSDELSIRREMGFLDDWSILMNALTLDETQDLPNGSQRLIYSGYAPACLLQDFFGSNMFGSFMYSVEQLINDEIPCTLIVDGSTMLPDTLTLSFTDEWTVSDMTFDTAEVIVYYSKWNQVQSIEAPKKATVTAIDKEEQFYATYYAWNLFLPYVGGQIDEQVSTGNTGQSFSSSWNTFQVRIDGGMTKIPLDYGALAKLGYSIDDNYSSIIMEPNKYKEGVVVTKGADKLICTFYNEDTVPQPISSCKIGCIDLSASNMPQNGIKIYLPGEVTLGITKEALLSAYGDAAEVKSAFSCDTFIWRGEGDMQSFLAEISPVTGQVIRIQVKYIPVTGGSQI